MTTAHNVLRSTLAAAGALLVAASAQNARHSAYEPVLTTIAYRWHPLFGQRLRLREGARRGGSDIVLVEDQPGRLRELPRWMCDPVACAGMDQGPPRVALQALVKLAAVLDEMSGRRAVRVILRMSSIQEVAGASTSPTIASPTAPELRADRDQLPKVPPSAALLEALAELLLAAMGMMTATTGSGEASDEHQDRR